jgi:hypothetical protein
MVTIMDMESGRLLEVEFGPFMDQVLDANWLPPLELAVGLQELAPKAAIAQVPFDVDDFLRTVYRSQE